jgi:hypothetical protein
MPGIEPINQFARRKLGSGHRGNGPGRTEPRGEGRRWGEGNRAGGAATQQWQQATARYIGRPTSSPTDRYHPLHDISRPISASFASLTGCSEASIHKSPSRGGWGRAQRAPSGG